MSHDQLVQSDQPLEQLEALNQAEIINVPTGPEGAPAQVHPLDELFVNPQETLASQGELESLLVEHEAVIVDIERLLELRKTRLNNDDRGLQNVA